MRWVAEYFTIEQVGDDGFETQRVLQHVCIFDATSRVAALLVANGLTLGVAASIGDVPEDVLSSGMLVVEVMSLNAFIEAGERKFRNYRRKAEKIKADRTAKEEDDR